MLCMWWAFRRKFLFRFVSLTPVCPAEGTRWSWEKNQCFTEVCHSRRRKFTTLFSTYRSVNESRRSSCYEKDAASLLECVIQKKVPFIPVRNGVRQTDNKYFLSITTYNSSKIQTREEEDHGTRIIGDSIVREQQEFYGNFDAFACLVVFWMTFQWRGNQWGRQ